MKTKNYFSISSFFTFLLFGGSDHVSACME